MAVVAGRNRVNRPYFFKDVDGERVEFPSFGTGQGDLEGSQLREYTMYVRARQLDATEPEIAPENTALPTITGTVQIGSVLTSTTGSWTGNPAPTYARQWKADGVDISGATAATYTIVAGDVGAEITVEVTATNSAGSAMAESAAVGPVPAIPPANTALPVITGTAQVGETLTVSNGTWTGTPAPTYSYQWQRGTTNIAGATGASYTLVSADAGSTVRVVVTATNSAGSESANSASTASVTEAPSNTALPAITGTAQVGETLTATPGTWSGDPAPTYTYQWQRNAGSWVSIFGATASTYTPVEGDVGVTIRVAVTATNSAGSASANSASTASVTEAPANTALPVITGTAQVGETLTVSNGTWTGTPAPTYAYQWEADGSDISGATATTYDPVEDDIGAVITCTVTATNAAGSASVTTNGTDPVVAEA